MLKKSQTVNVEKKVEFDINGILFKKSLINDLINLDIESN